jgi:cytidyltransferase-like protein
MRCYATWRLIMSHVEVYARLFARPDQVLSLARSYPALSCMRYKGAIKMEYEAKMSNKEKRIFVDGIFDLFHEGHKNLIKNAIDKTQELHPDCKIVVVVGVCGKGVEAYKRKTIMTLDERLDAVQGFMQLLTSTNPHLTYEIVPNSPITHTREFVKNNRLDIIFHGSDFTQEKIDQYYGAIKDICDFQLLPYTPGVSTTQLIVGPWRNGLFSKPTDNVTRIATDKLAQRVQGRCLEELGIGVEQYHKYSAS